MEFQPTVSDGYYFIDLRLICRSWEDTLAPVQHITRIVQLPRPTVTASKVEDSGDGAEEVVTIRRQNRRRTRDLEDGTTVYEEQEYVATERRVIWEPVKRVKEDSSTIEEAKPDPAIGRQDGDGTLCVD